MMKRRVLLVLLVVSIVAGGPLFAGKIGFVDARRAVSEVDEGQVKLKQLDGWAGPQREELLELSARLGEIQGQVAKQSAVGSEESIVRLRDEETRLRRAFEDKKLKFDRELNAKTDEFLADVAVKVGTVASDYGKANGFDAIFMKNAQPLIYISDQSELTDTVIRLYNVRFPVGSGAE